MAVGYTIDILYIYIIYIIIYKYVCVRYISVISYMKGL